MDNCSNCKSIDAKSGTVREYPNGSRKCVACGRIFEDSRLELLRVEMSMYRDSNPNTMESVPEIFEFMSEIVDELIRRDEEGW